VGNASVIGKQLSEPAQISQGGRETAVVQHRPSWIHGRVGVVFRAEA
jgi:hypothetical protein